MGDPWVLDPEVRDNIPSIELYSVLVTGIPKKSSDMLYEIEKGKKITGLEKDIQWQLKVVSAFFDQCVPTQPGFSSSVAAVSIIPDECILAHSWKKWLNVMKALRRLTFIRGLIAHQAEMKSFAVHEMEEIFEASMFGPEQTAEFDRERAAAAVTLCPMGCDEILLRHVKDINALSELEKEAAEDLMIASEELRNARTMSVVDAFQTIESVQDDTDSLMEVSDPLPQRKLVEDYTMNLATSVHDAGMVLDSECKLILHNRGPSHKSEDSSTPLWNRAVNLSRKSYEDSIFAKIHLIQVNQKVQSVNLMTVYGM